MSDATHLDELVSIAESASSDYLRREAQKQEAQLAQALWKRIESSLDADDFASLLDVMRDLKARAEASESEESSNEEIRSLKHQVSKLRGELSDAQAELRSR